MTLVWGKGFLVPVLIGSTISMTMYTSRALADKDDTFNFVIDSSYEHDDNLFRLPDGQKPTGSGAERADNIWDTKIGISLDKKYSLQRFKFDYAHESVKFDNASFLDFEANNYFGAWMWALTPSLTGNLSSKRTVDLVPFIDYTDSNTRNMRTTKEQRFDFDYSPHNVWHLLGGYSNLDVENSQTFLPETSYKFDAVEVGVKYTFPSDSYITFMHRNRNGSQAENFANTIGSGFTEREEELRAFWLVTGKSKISANFGHNTREDDTFAIRDFSGYFGGINYAWDITSKLNLTVDLSRKLAAYQDNTSSYTTNDTLSIKPSWALTSKVKVNATAQVGKRKFLGNGPFVSAVDREDDTVYYSIGADWTPRETIKLGIALQHDERDSNAINRDYSSNMVGINGQITF